MTQQLLSNIKTYITERHEQMVDRYECTHSDYSLGKLDILDELENFITGELMHFEMLECDIYEI